MAKIEEGGEIATISNDKKITEISFSQESEVSRTINMSINNVNLSLLSIQEALAIQLELDKAVQKALRLDL